MFEKATIEVVKIDTIDVVTASGQPVFCDGDIGGCPFL